MLGILIIEEDRNRLRRTLGVIVLEDNWKDIQTAIEQQKYFKILHRMLVREGYGSKTIQDLLFDEDFEYFTLRGDSEYCKFYFESVPLYEVTK